LNPEVGPWRSRVRGSTGKFVIVGSHSWELDSVTGLRAVSTTRLLSLPNFSNIYPSTAALPSSPRGP
jgi:hypothetical protein